jgi:hypothetical protein
MLVRCLGRLAVVTAGLVLVGGFHPYSKRLARLVPPAMLGKNVKTPGARGARRGTMALHGPAAEPREVIWEMSVQAAHASAAGRGDRLASTYTRADRNLEGGSVMHSSSQTTWSLGITTLVIAANFLAAPTYADLYDGFEDGDWTANPTWFDANPGYGQDGGIVADPVRPDNLVWKAKGTEQAGRSIATSDFAPMPWTGFHSSVEFLTTTSYRFCGQLYVVDGNWSSGGPYYEVVSAWLWHDVTWGNQANLYMAEHRTDGSDAYQSTMFDLSLVPINEWLRLSLWHDPLTGLVMSDVRRVSDGQLIIGSSMAPATLGGPSPLSYVGIGAEELEWQYMDNVTLTHELLMGDLSCDGALNTFDIDPFVLALTSPEAYATAFPECDRMLADVNCDGLLNAFDIDPFVLCLTGGGCPPCP